MDGQILETVTEWNAVPVDDGADGLAGLVDREFTGAVTDGVGWLFFLNGRGVGVVEGTVDDFTDAELTAREAPDDSLPLLYAMMSNGTETRAQYYTEETPLSAAHETLESGGFTGFVELSENVLSGDYYVVYYGGRSLPVAFVGASRKLLTGDEAFERADDEVGIYHVNEASISVLDLPTGDADGAGGGTEDDAADDTNQQATAFGAAGGGAADDGDDPTAADADESDDSGVGFDATAALGGDADDETAAESVGAADAPASDSGLEADEAETPPEDERAESDDERAESDDERTAPEDERDTSVEADETPDREEPDAGNDEEDTESAATTTRPEREEADTSTDAPTEAEPDASQAADTEAEETPEVTFGGDDDPDTGDDAETGTAGAGVGAGTDADADAGVDPLDDDSVFDEEAQWRETQVIPPLSPDDEGPDDVTVADLNPGSGQPDRSRANDSNEATEGRSASLAELRERLERVEAEREKAEERAAAAAAERDEVTEERDELRAEADRLRERVESLEAEVERLEELLDSREDEGSVTADSETMSAESALAGTSVFVRYDTKGGATLEKARDGDADKESVNGNLRLEYHTTFDSDPVAVDGEDFETFLHGTTEYEFVRWLVEDFIYELQDTGNRGSMQELYDVLPEIDRVEFRGSVSLRYDENGDEHREQRTFDVVVRDRMGNPLAVADINASREATGEAELASLVEGTKRLGQTTETVAAAFAVTASFFDPAALEVATEETKSGLLGRSKGKSYVKLSRKSGFHLVLVESRHGQFHVNVPEL